MSEEKRPMSEEKHPSSDEVRPTGGGEPPTSGGEPPTNDEKGPANRRRRVAVSVGLILLALLGGWGVVRTTEPYRIWTVRLQCKNSTRDGRARQEELKEFRDLIYVKDQVVLVGPTNSVPQVAGTLNVQDLDRGVNLDGETSIHLYKIPEGHSVQQVLCMVNGSDRVEGFGEQVGVSADPNYHTSPAGWSGGGSPWTQNGDWVAEPGGGIGQGIPINSDFISQWAFSEARGIHLFDAAGNRTTGGLTGDRTHIAVFDTSPFSDTYVPGGECRDCTLQQLGMDPGDVPPAFADMHLTVFHYPVGEAPDCPGWDRSLGDEYKPEYSLEDQDVSNHGLFVASLAHTVAPSSTLYLVRVLENDGCGSLVTIEESISRFVSWIEEEKTDGLQGVILNLSLGVHEPPDAEEDFALPPVVESLSQTLHSAIISGAIVVAAAGNDSYSSTVPLEMEIPAQNSDVIGVAASNSDRTRACFSNADLTASELRFAAPGGQGVKGEIQISEGQFQEIDCAIPKVSDCKDSTDSPCIIGLIAKDTPGYAYWFGTSFSTPLISGAAALVVEKEGLIPPDQVAAAIAVGSCSAAVTPSTIQITNLPKTMGLIPDCPP